MVLIQKGEGHKTVWFVTYGKTIRYFRTRKEAQNRLKWDKVLQYEPIKKAVMVYEK